MRKKKDFSLIRFVLLLVIVVGATGIVGLSLYDIPAPQQEVTQSLTVTPKAAETAQ